MVSINQVSIDNSETNPSNHSHCMSKERMTVMTTLMSSWFLGLIHKKVVEDDCIKQAVVSILTFTGGYYV